MERRSALPIAAMHELLARGRASGAHPRRHSGPPRRGWHDPLSKHQMVSCVRCDSGPPPDIEPPPRAAIASDDDEILAMSGDEIRIGTGIQKETDRVDMTFPYREVKRLAIARKLRVALEQLLKRCRITRARGADGFPDVAPAAGPRSIGTFGCEFVRSDQVEIVTVRRSDRRLVASTRSIRRRHVRAQARAERRAG